MAQTKKVSKKRSVKVGEDKTLSQSVSRIKKVRAAQLRQVKSVIPEEEKPEAVLPVIDDREPDIRVDVPVIVKPAPKARASGQGCSRKGLLNKIFFQFGALLSDGNALLGAGKTE